MRKYQHSHQEQRQRFSLRKSAFGATSVLLGALFLIASELTVQAEAGVDTTTITQDCDCSLDKTSLDQDIVKKEGQLAQLDQEIAMVKTDMETSQQELDTIQAATSSSPEQLKAELDDNMAKKDQVQKEIAATEPALTATSSQLTEAQADLATKTQELEAVIKQVEADAIKRIELEKQRLEKVETFKKAQEIIDDVESWNGTGIQMYSDLITSSGESYFEVVTTETILEDIEHQRVIYKTLEAELEDSKSYFARTGKHALVRRVADIYEEAYKDTARRRKGQKDSDWKPASVNYQEGDKEELLSPGEFVPSDYKPQMDKVTAHALGYIKELRAINHISTENIVITQDALDYAQFRAEELAKGMIPDKADRHSTNNLYTQANRKRVTENIAQFGTEFPKHLNTQFLHSDQEMAYYLLLRWFAEYMNSQPNFGHAENLLNLDNVEFGMGGSGKEFTYTLTEPATGEFKFSTTRHEGAKVDFTIFQDMFNKRFALNFPEGLPVYLDTRVNFPQEKFEIEDQKYQSVYINYIDPEILGRDRPTDLPGQYTFETTTIGDLGSGKLFTYTSPLGETAKFFKRHTGQWYRIEANGPRLITDFTEEPRYSRTTQSGEQSYKTPATFLPKTTFIYPVEPQAFTEFIKQTEERLVQTKQLIATFIKHEKSPINKEWTKRKQELAKVEEALVALKDSDDLTAIKAAQTQAQHLVNQLTQDQTKLQNRLIDLKQQLQTLKDEEQKFRAALAQTSQDQANRQGLEKHLNELHKRQKTLEQDRDKLNQTLTDLRAKQDRLAELCLPSVTRELRQTPTGVAVYEVTMVNGKWQSEKQVDFHYNSLRTEDTAFVTRYQADTSLTAGQTRVKETGQVGRREAGVIYTVKDGQLVTTPIDRVLTEAVPELILVGTKPVITTEPIAYLTSYQADDSLEKGKEMIAQAGVLGEKTMTISYALDTMSGQVTANQPTEAITLKPTAELIRVGSQPTTVSKELAFGTVYQADDRLEVGETFRKSWSRNPHHDLSVGGQ